MVKEEKDVLAKEKIEETVEETTKRETAKVTKEKVEKEIPIQSQMLFFQM